MFIIREKESEIKAFASMRLEFQDPHVSSFGYWVQVLFESSLTRNSMA